MFLNKIFFILRKANVLHYYYTSTILLYILCIESEDNLIKGKYHQGY